MQQIKAKGRIKIFLMKFYVFFFEPGCIAGMMLLLRRTLVLKNSYELLAASHEQTK